MVCKVAVVIQSWSITPHCAKLCEPVGKCTVAILTGQWIHHTESRSGEYLLNWIQFRDTSVISCDSLLIHLSGKPLWSTLSDCPFVITGCNSMVIVFKRAFLPLHINWRLDRLIGSWKTQSSNRRMSQHQDLSKTHPLRPVPVDPIYLPVRATHHWQLAQWIPEKISKTDQVHWGRCEEIRLCHISGGCRGFPGQQRRKSTNEEDLNMDRGTLISTVDIKSGPLDWSVRCAVHSAVGYYAQVAHCG